MTQSTPETLEPVLEALEHRLLDLDDALQAVADTRVALWERFLQMPLSPEVADRLRTVLDAQEAAREPVQALRAVLDKYISR